MHPLLYLVAGLGKTGLSVARYLKKRGHSFAAFDTRVEVETKAAFALEFPDVPVYLGTFPSELVSQLTTIIASPGLPLDLPLFQQAKTLGIPIYGDIECLVREITAPVIAITGTNGKSTVTTLVGEMAKLAGFNVAVAGNIGQPVLSLLDDGQSYNLWVLELSSFQLDLLHSLRSKAATILNVSPDHLDRHHTLEAYIAAKKRIYHQAQGIVFNRQDRATFPDDNSSLSISFGLDTPSEGQWGIIKQNNTTYIAKGNRCLLSVDDVRIKGLHNWQNAMAACAIADMAGIASEYQIEALRTFSGLPHRCQWVRSFDAVEWLNDSKGTNVGATLSAIEGIGESISGKIVLIAGGQGKGADFKALQAPVKAYVRTVVLLGEDKEKLADALQNQALVLRANSLEEAVFLAHKEANPGDTVLLSPACASLDMFKDFNHRGEVFTELVTRL
jgi:UDP-N-acetylmuramoylalanine--D-glutamate ligase